jgi:predicted nucleotidyltransferase
MTDDTDDTDDPFDGVYTAVLDRYEDDIAVLVVGDEEQGRDIAERLVERTALPADARAVDTVLEVTFVDGEPVEFEARPEETSERAEAAQSRFDRLSRRRQRSDSDSE